VFFCFFNASIYIPVDRRLRPNPLICITPVKQRLDKVFAIIKTSDFRGFEDPFFKVGKCTFLYAHNLMKPIIFWPDFSTTGNS
jgi:hypothetical protein